MQNQTNAIAPVPFGQAPDNMAAQTALDLETLLEQEGLHIFNLDMGVKHHCLITSIDSFVDSARPLLKKLKQKLCSSLAVALQELAAAQINRRVGTDYDLCEPSVTLLTVSEFLELVEDEGTAWTCADAYVQVAVQSALEAKGMQFVAPGHTKTFLYLDITCLSTEALLVAIFEAFNDPGTRAVFVNCHFSSRGELIGADGDVEMGWKYRGEEKACFTAALALDVANLGVESGGYRLCTATFMLMSEIAQCHDLGDQLLEHFLRNVGKVVTLPVDSWSDGDELEA